MTCVYLIRHGQASFGKENYDQLSALGHIQATRLGESMKKWLPLFDRVHLGSMLRHKQTANNCLAAYGHSIDPSTDKINERINAVIDQGWNEYNHQQILSNYHPEFVTHERMKSFLKKQDNPKQAFEYHFTQAMNRWISEQHNDEYTELWSDFKSRVHSSLRQVLEAQPQAKNIAVFTSGGPISLITQSLLGIESEKIMKMNWTLLNCGVTKLVITSDRVFLSTLNEHSHFKGDKRFLTYT